jgi:aminomethyltransferase
VEADLSELGYYTFVDTTWRDVPMLVSRNGYTGEDGFELYIDSGHAVELWQALFVAGGDRLAPAGLGARDTLRLEVAYPLYGHELGRDVTPIEAGLGWVVKTKDRTFPGSDTLRHQKKSGAPRKLVGLEFEGRVIGRQGATILHDNDAVGVVTSGTFGPTVKKGIALGLVPRELAGEHTRFRIDVRGRRIEARVVSLPFYEDGTHL